MPDPPSPSSPAIRGHVPLSSQAWTSRPKIKVGRPGGFRTKTATAVRLKMPPLNQFRLHNTYWAARYGVRVKGLGQQYRLAGGSALSRATSRLEHAVNKAPSQHTKAEARKVRTAHRALRARLKQAGAKPSELKALDKDLWTYELYWKKSGPTACAYAAERALQLLGAKPTYTGSVTSGARKRLVKNTPLYAGYLQRRQPGDKLYKGRWATYTVRHTKAQLKRAATRIIAKLRAGHAVHVRVLTGVLHRDTGKTPKASHSLVIDGYTQRNTGKTPTQVDFHFTDPDGGGSGVLRLDVAKGRFEHVPQNMGWYKTTKGWDYDAQDPPYRYQVLSVR